MSAGLADRVMLAILTIFAAYLQVQIHGVQATLEGFDEVDVANHSGQHKQELNRTLNVSADYDFPEEQLMSIDGSVGGAAAPPLYGDTNVASRTDIRSPSDISWYNSRNVEPRSLGAHVSPDDMTVYIKDDDRPRSLGAFIPVYDPYTASLLRAQ